MTEPVPQTVDAATDAAAHDGLPAARAAHAGQTARGAEDRTTAIVLVSVIGTAVLVACAMAVLGMSTMAAQAERDRSQAVREALLLARLAQETYAVETGRYSADVEDLLDRGFPTGGAADVRIVHASEDTYCLAGSPPGGDAVLWSTQADALLTAPCD